MSNAEKKSLRRKMIRQQNSIAGRGGKIPKMQDMISAHYKRLEAEKNAK